MSGDLNLDDLKDEPILYYENALSYVFSKSNDDVKKDVPTCIIYPNQTLKVGLPIYSIKNINRNENIINDIENENERFNDEPLITYASSSKPLYKFRVSIYYSILYSLIAMQLLILFCYRDNVNYLTTGELNRGQAFIFSFMVLSHTLVIITKNEKLKTYLFDVYTSLSLFFFILSTLSINCFSSAFIAVIQFFIFFVHVKLDCYVMAQSCVIFP
ncbi:conserved protein, unknown function [Hepatocystis sp. ex Piliocolobus tephrosceles]|nr:conserved protein, unknown function [Hepatocystis sp. ex Piliocolobus tephrosceles]